MRRLRAEDGFTLPELLVTMAIALIVSLATFSLIEVVMKRSGDIGARVETTQRGRTAMDLITRQLRSQVCAAARRRWRRPRRSTPPTPDVADLFADFSERERRAAARCPSARTLRTISLGEQASSPRPSSTGIRRDTGRTRVSYAAHATPSRGS